MAGKLHPLEAKQIKAEREAAQLIRDAVKAEATARECRNKAARLKAVAEEARAKLDKGRK